MKLINQSGRKWTSVQIVLEHIGFQKYVRIFEENDIDYETFLGLSKDECRELHLPLCARKKIMSEIDVLKRMETKGK